MAAACLARAACVLLALSAPALAYTVDCNREYTDCERELRKLDAQDASATNPDPLTPKTTAESTEATPLPGNVQPQPRLLNLSLDDLQTFANTLHNQTEGRKDLSDVTIDDDDVELPKAPDRAPPKPKDIVKNKFVDNLHFEEAPADVGSTCRDGEQTYKVGERTLRGCEETCVCAASGRLECSPRCQRPYVRRGRAPADPLCFESPVDDCCAIVACAAGNGADTCTYNNASHAVGSTWNVGCQQVCSCEPHAVVMCKPRCPTLPQSDKCINVADPSDSCCEMQVCDVSRDDHEEPENATTPVAATIPTPTPTVTQVAAETAATRAPSFFPTPLPTTMRRDDDTTENITPKSPVKPMRPLVLTEPIGSVRVLQNNTVQVNLMHPNNTDDPIHLLLSNDGGKTYSDIELVYSNLIINLEAGKDYVLKTRETGTNFNFTITTTDTNHPDVNEVPDEIVEASKEGCEHDGKLYAVGEEFHIGCSELCECVAPGQRECAALECPNHVGLELVSRGCVQWAPSPPLEPPNCCPRSARCLSDGTCHYKGHDIPNWSEVPIEYTGCEQRCFCENGELDCQEVCSPLPAVPPRSLHCPPGHRAAPVNMSDDDCCKEWGCALDANAVGPNFLPPKPSVQKPSFLPTVPPSGEADEDYDHNNLHRPVAVPDVPQLPHLPTLPSYEEDNKRLTVISIQADSPTSVKMLFGLPPVLVGLRGSVDLRYTDLPTDDVSQWFSQVFAPADEVLGTARLEFRLTGLKPSTVYRIKGKLYLHNINVEPESAVYSVKTLDLPVVPTQEEKRREVDAQLTAADGNDTAALVSWRRFTDQELVLIDGIQVRYRPVGTPIYLMTELLHHGRTHATLADLRPGTRYEASLVLVPPPAALTELHDPRGVVFTTQPYVDPYNWSVTLTGVSTGAGAAQLSWRGVPAPAERWVRVYRAAHTCGASRRETDAFKLVTRDEPMTITVTGLQSDSRCRVWLELFLTNGKVKTSNVLEINTKPEDQPEDVDNAIEASAVGGAGPRGDYYGALVGVGVVAALGALTSLLLLLVVVRRHRPRSVPITPVPSAPREGSLPPYDNPAYKLELQQETMDL